jgi:uncharacterized membrane protein
MTPPSKKKKHQNSPQVSEPETETRVVASHQQFSGPLPHPDVLRQYDLVVPGAARSIMQSFLQQGEHRRGLEAREAAMLEDWANADIKLQKRGQFFGFSLGVIGIGGGLIAAVMGAPASGTIVGGASLVAIVIAFIRRGSPDKPSA